VLVLVLLVLLERELNPNLHHYYYFVYAEAFWLGYKRIEESSLPDMTCHSEEEQHQQQELQS
jgi:hypothetical protein